MTRCREIVKEVIMKRTPCQNLHREDGRPDFQRTKNKTIIRTLLETPSLQKTCGIYPSSLTLLLLENPKQCLVLVLRVLVLIGALFVHLGQCRRALILTAA